MVRSSKRTGVRRLAAVGLAGACFLGIAGPIGGRALAAPAAGPTFINCDINSSQLANTGEETALLTLINQYRVASGATALKPDYLLTRTALWKSNEMSQVVAMGGSVQHDDAIPVRTWQQRFADCAYSTTLPDAHFGENVTGGNETASEAFINFKNSPLHNANMLNPDFKYVGIKRVTASNPNDKYLWYWTVTFGSELSQDLSAAVAGQPFPTTVVGESGSAASTPSAAVHAGWNLVALPSGTSFAGASGQIYTLQPGDQNYQTLPVSTPAKAGFGYWAYFPSSQLLSVTADSGDSYRVTLAPGSYVMIGNPSGTHAVTVSGADSVLTYDAAQGIYVQTTTLQPGQGAWAYSANGGTVTLQ